MCISRLKAQHISQNSVCLQEQKKYQLGEENKGDFRGIDVVLFLKLLVMSVLSIILKKFVCTVYISWHRDTIYPGTWKLRRNGNKESSHRPLRKKKKSILKLQNTPKMTTKTVYIRNDGIQLAQRTHGLNLYSFVLCCFFGFFLVQCIVFQV